MEVLLLGIFGLVVGSFLAALTYRLPRGISLSGRSRCPQCGKTIEWYDNIPLLSYLALGGRCRSCGKKISLRYPLIELGTALLFILVGASFFLGVNYGIHGIITDYKGWLGLWAFPYFLFIVTALAAIFVIDLEHKIIPDQILLLTLIFTLLTLILFSPSPTLFINFSWGIFLANFLYLIHVATGGRGMGLGDVNLSFLMGLVLGYPAAVVAIFSAFLTGAIVGIILVLAKRARFGRPIPFGPFLVAGTIISLFAGKTLLAWYLR